jgi:drug/metabolite transporter (DMT)-like permease
MKGTIWAAFGALCLLLASSWLLPATTIEASPIAQQSCFYAAVGLVGWGFSYRQLFARLKRREWLCLRLAGVSVLLLGLPVVLGEWARDGISDISRAALFGLVPFVVVVVAMMREVEPGVRRFFAPALAGFGGALLLLPFNFPASLRGRIMFGVLLVTIVLVGFASESVYRMLRGFGMMEVLVVVCLSNAVFLAACHFAGLPFAESWSSASSLISIHSLYSLVELLLLVWLLREMSPVRLAVRYLVVPLFTVLEGFAFLRPAPTVRMGAGLVLLVGGAAYLLLSRGWDSDAVLSIR